MVTYQLDTRVNLTITECGGCGAYVAFTPYQYRKAQEEGETFYCSRGHARVYCETEVGRLQKALDQAQVQVSTLETQKKNLEGELLTATKARVALKKRIGNGVCIECHRHFTNLERHMKTKHLKP